jgi:hypothetical protein
MIASMDVPKGLFLCTYGGVLFEKTKVRFSDSLMMFGGETTHWVDANQTGGYGRYVLVL